MENVYDNYFNLHLLPMYQKKFAYGSKGFPWKSQFTKRKVNYSRGICPVAEKLNEKKILLIELCVNEFNNKEIGLLLKSFKKVWANMDKLKDLN